MTETTATPVTFKAAKIPAGRSWTTQSAVWVTRKSDEALLGRIFKVQDSTRTGSGWSAENVRGQRVGYFETRAAAAQALVAARATLEAERAAR